MTLKSSKSIDPEARGFSGVVRSVSAAVGGVGRFLRVFVFFGVALSFLPLWVFDAPMTMDIWMRYQQSPLFRLLVLVCTCVYILFRYWRRMEQEAKG